jgi:transcriptional regulator with XRE-family HTH domain
MNRHETNEVERSSERRALGEYLREARTGARLSQAHAALSLGVTQSAVAKLEAGNRQLSFWEAIELAALYGVTLDSIAAGRRTRESVVPNTRTLSVADEEPAERG